MEFYPTSDILSKEDYKYPFTFNHELYMAIIEERKRRGLPIRGEYKESYDTRTGYYIDGTRINTRHHPYHDMWLVDKITGEKFIIDCVTVQHDFGKYITLTKRAPDSESHGVVIFENISCHYPFIIEQIELAKEQYELVPKDKP